MKQIVRFKVNGMEEEKAVHTHHTLLEVLRAEFKLFGAREVVVSACAAHARCFWTAGRQALVFY